VEYILAGLDLLLRMTGWSMQVAAQQAAERDEAAIAAYQEASWPVIRTAADLGAWLCFEDESGQGLRPPKGRTWGRRGHIPVVTVTGTQQARVGGRAAVHQARGACLFRLRQRGCRRDHHTSWHTSGSRHQTRAGAPP
jgi:hypothetical protein